jgi:RNA recognition motif-containing protein
VTEEFLEMVFTPFGTTADIIVKKHSFCLQTGRIMGYGCVFYYAEDAAYRAVNAANNAMIEGVHFTCQIVTGVESAAAAAVLTASSQSNGMMMNMDLMDGSGSITGYHHQSRYPANSMNGVSSANSVTTNAYYDRPPAYPYGNQQHHQQHPQPGLKGNHPATLAMKQSMMMQMMESSAGRYTPNGRSSSSTAGMRSQHPHYPNSTNQNQYEAMLYLQQQQQQREREMMMRYPSGASISSTAATTNAYNTLGNSPTTNPMKNGSFFPSLPQQESFPTRSYESKFAYEATSSANFLNGNNTNNNNNIGNSGYFPDLNSSESLSIHPLSSTWEIPGLGANSISSGSTLIMPPGHYNHHRDLDDFSSITSSLFPSNHTSFNWK